MRLLYRSPRLRAACLVAGMALLGSARPSLAATITVTSSGDLVAVDGDCTLREAVRAANTDTAVDGCAAGRFADRIVFAASAGQTITLSGGQIVITDEVTIGPAGQDTVRVVATPFSRHFRVAVAAEPGPPAFQKLVAFVGLLLRGGFEASPGGGGAILVEPDQTTAFTRVTFDRNLSAGPGGALRLGSGFHTLTGVTFTSNTTTAATGGGGAVFNGGGTLTVVGGALADNRAAAASGGALANAAGGIVSLSGTAFRANQAARSGGAVETAGTLTVSGGTFVANRAEVNGGAVHVSGTTAATFTATVPATAFERNAAGMEGGAVWNSATGVLTMSGTRVSGNTAAGPAADQGGGGVFSDGGITTLIGVAVTGNAATGAAGSGGGVLNTAGGRLTVVGGSISGNTAVRAGGGIETNQSGTATGNTATLTNVMLSGNTAGTAPGFGGGLHTTGAAAVTFIGGSVIGNTAVEGGGVWIADAGTLAVTGTRVASNTATGTPASQGGGIYSGGTLTLADADIGLNRASGVASAGGGLVVGPRGRAEVDRTRFGGNVAVRAGGGVYNSDGARVALRRSTFTSNVASASFGAGGGLHNAGTGEALLDTCVVLNNEGGALSTAVGTGGGLWNSGEGRLTVRYTTVNRNVGATGSGIYQAAGTAGVTRVENSAVGGNSSNPGLDGGGIAAAGGLVVVQNSTVSDNFAVNGGGLASSGGRFVLSNATITGNFAWMAGGGIYAPASPGDSLFTLDNTIVSNNNAARIAVDVSGTVRSLGYNLVTEMYGGALRRTAGAGPDLLGVPARFQSGSAPVGGNGGPTGTRAVAADSPAVGAGRSRFTVDQRGFARQARSTIGAFEFGGVPVASESAVGDALAFGLSRAAPNPFRVRTTLQMTTPTSEAVEVLLYDALGRRVATLYAGTPGENATVAVTVDAASLAPGVYVVRMTSATRASTQRITVAR